VVSPGEAARGAMAMTVSVGLADLVAALDALLQPAAFDDYCPNGLQVEGKPRIERLVTGVTACQALLDAAIARGADAILVHHGYFWRGENPCLTGLRRARVATLLRHDVSLLAYHLPLDAHPELGNNARLGALLGLGQVAPLGRPGDGVMGLIGALPSVVDGAAFGAGIAAKLGRVPLHIAALRPVGTVAWCTGAGQGFIEHAIARGADAYVTGEASEQTVHIAREAGIHFYAAGHHATERCGVQAVGEHLAAALGIEHAFVDIDNPV